MALRMNLNSNDVVCDCLQARKCSQSIADYLSAHGDMSITP